MWTYNNELYHYGVLGMKWGRRRFQDKSGALTPAGRKRYNDEIDAAKSALDKAKIDYKTEKAAYNKATLGGGPFMIKRRLLSWKKQTAWSGIQKRICRTPKIKQKWHRRIINLNDRFVLNRNT